MKSEENVYDTKLSQKSFRNVTEYFYQFQIHKEKYNYMINLKKEQNCDKFLTPSKLFSLQSMIYAFSMGSEIYSPKECLLITYLVTYLINFSGGKIKL